MEYEKKGILVYQQGKTITDQFYMDDDYNVPDSKSDVRRVVLGECKLQVEDMKRVENYIRVSGKMCFKVLYVADEAEEILASLDGKLPFEEMVYLEEEPFNNLFVKASSADITVSVIHSRKLNLKILAELQICSEGKGEEEVTMDVCHVVPIYKKYREQNMLRLFTIKKDTYRIKEEVILNGTKENIGSLLWTEIISRKLDTRISQDQILLQGELLFFCFYESMDGKTDWLEQTIPYEGRIECYGANDSMYHQIYPELTDTNVDVRMDEDGEMRVMGVEATLEARVVVYEEEQMRILDDVYSLQETCRPTTREKRFEQLLMQNHSKCKVVEQLSLPEIKNDILQICHSSGWIQVEHTEPVDAGLQIEGVLHVTFLYVKSDDKVPFDVWQGMVPFSYLLESNSTASDMSCDLTYAVEQISIGLLGNDEIEVKAVLAFNSFLKQPVVVNDIEEIQTTAVNVEELEKRPGIVGYIVKDGDELWDLAKRYNTTSECIREVNQLAECGLKTGDRLLIFKENMSIL
ncbi:MAG: SPOCS domain-containing protein [Dorea sp.]